jgi:DNA-binding response OmpR family regulator
MRFDGRAGQTRPIPVIVCTAALRSLQDHEPLLRSYGVYSLPKPFDLDALLALVQAALNRDPPASSPTTPDRIL